ncbi:hypothetical protein [Mucilaginibacter sp. BT774]|uniref:hypothetical protein n=1 Tax=Mucilaginibacter sp. BT774 TaxID=3062276 RepID=UPI002677042C|nr:hypothetical protein [Mucilaginibacter sp. BT774]
MLRSAIFLSLLCLLLLNGCKSNKQSSHTDTVKTTADNSLTVSTANQDSIQLTLLVRKLYKWHVTDTMKHDGFKPTKSNPKDTLYTGIDLAENEKAVEELKETGIFADSFLNDYRKIAVRMDKELKDGSSLWPDGELSTFGDDVDDWCDCQDTPVNDYWKIIKLKDIKINNNEASFKWNWGDDLNFKVRAVKDNGNWKISYLQGFDMNSYSWEWWKNNKGKAN